MQCSGYLDLNKVNRVETENTDREEGIAAHWYVEQVVKGNFTTPELIDRRAPNGVYITAEMAENCEKYLRDVLQSGEIETDTSHSLKDVYEIRGRADHLDYDPVNKILIVRDFKYGWKIVNPDNNWTLISHAYGACLKYNIQPQTVIFTIYQPRPYHPEGDVRQKVVQSSTFNILVQGMLDRLNERQFSKYLKTGEHCYKCPAMVHCGAMNKTVNAVFDYAEDIFEQNIPDDKLSERLEHLKRAADIIKQNLDAYSDLAYHRIKAGKNVPKYSLVNDYGRNNWIESANPELLSALTGKDLRKKELVTPSQAIRLGADEKVINSLVERKNKGVKLVRIDENELAKKLFERK